MLLLLLTSPNGLRERAWLQDKLWSDRGKEQGAGSLRQAIYQCKKSLGEDAGILLATKLRISINLSNINIVDQQRGDFAEGLDVRDPEFETWLNLERSSRADEFEPALVSTSERVRPSLPPLFVTLTIDAAEGSSPLAEWFTQVTADQCANMLLQLIGAHVVSAGESTEVEPEFQLSLSTVQSKDGWLFVRGRLKEAPLWMQVWSGHRVVCEAEPTKDENILQMVFEIAETIRQRLSQRSIHPSGGPPMLSSKAIGSMFSMTAEGAEHADHLLATAFEQKPHATHLAWQAQVRVIQFFERYKSANSDVLGESQQLSRQALERDPNNAVVLALVSNSLNFLEGRTGDALDHASRAVELSVGNPFAWWTLASAQLYAENAPLAYTSASKSRELLRGSTLEFLPESILGGAALAMNSYAVALRHFERSLSFRPSFKPSLRYAIGLNTKLGHVDRARSLTARLIKLEDGFSPQQLIEDGSYPTSFLRGDDSLGSTLFQELE